MFYTSGMRVEYREEPCKVALNRVRGMPFEWSSNPFSIITRGPLVVRDVDVLADAARRADVSVMVSVPTLDQEVWRKTEPGTSPPHQRLRALRTVVDAGVRATVAMAPVLPGLSD